MIQEVKRIIKDSEIIKYGIYKTFNDERGGC